MSGMVHLDGFDGARDRKFELPEGWHGMTEEQQDDVAREVKRKLMEDSVSWSWNQDVYIEGCDCYGCGES